MYTTKNIKRLARPSFFGIYWSRLEGPFRNNISRKARTRAGKREIIFENKPSRNARADCAKSYSETSPHRILGPEPELVLVAGSCRA